MIAYLLGLYLLGVLLVWPWRGHLPGWFIVATGGLWGSVVMAVLTLAVLVAGLRLTPGLMIALALTLTLISWGWRWRQTGSLGEVAAQGVHLPLMLPLALIMMAAIAVLDQADLVFGTPDSYAFIGIGYDLVTEGMTQAAASPLTSFGSFVAVHQAYATFHPTLDMIVGFQPMLTLHLGVVVAYVSSLISQRQGLPPRLTGVVIFIGFALMATTYLGLGMAQFVHGNAAATVYLFVGVSFLWLALLDGDNAGADEACRLTWWRFALLAFMGFTLTRIESPMFTLLFLTLALTLRSWPGSVRLGLVLPFVLLLLAWYLFLYGVTLRDPGRLLSPTNLQLILAGFIGFALFLVGLPLRWVAPYTRYVPALTLVGLSGMWLFFGWREPQIFQVSLVSWAQNLFGLVAWWSLIWSLMVLVAWLTWDQRPPLRYGALLALGSVGFILLVLILPHGRDAAYRVGWGDSGNRMMFHILPLIVLYLSLKLTRTLQASPPPTATGGQDAEAQV